MCDIYKSEIGIDSLTQLDTTCSLKCKAQHESFLFPTHRKILAQKYTALPVKARRRVFPTKPDLDVLVEEVEGASPGFDHAPATVDAADAELASDILDLLLAESPSPTIEMTEADNDGDNLLPLVGPNGFVLSPMRPPSPVRVPRHRFAPPVAPAGLFQPETPFLRRPLPIDNTPSPELNEQRPSLLTPSDNQQIEMLKSELEKYKKSKLQLHSKLWMEWKKSWKAITDCISF